MEVRFSRTRVFEILGINTERIEGTGKIIGPNWSLKLGSFNQMSNKLNEFDYILISS